MSEKTGVSEIAQVHIGGDCKSSPPTGATTISSVASSSRMPKAEKPVAYVNALLPHGRPKLSPELFRGDHKTGDD